MGGGLVRFGGRIGFDGYVPGDLDVTVARQRYPSSLSRRHPIGRGRCRSGGSRQRAGAHTRRHGDRQERAVDTAVRHAGNLFDLAGRRAAAGRPRPRAAPSGGSVSVEFDVQILVPSTLGCENNLVADGRERRPHAARHLRSSGALRPRRRRPRRGDVRRAALPRHPRIDRFHESHAHRAVLRRRGRDQRAGAGPDLPGHGGRRRARPDRLRPTLSSDPPLPAADVLALLFSDVRSRPTTELRALQNPNAARRMTS